jgi:hypothetical protein
MGRRGFKKSPSLEFYFTCGGLHYNDGVELFDLPTSCNKRNIDLKDLPPIEEMMLETSPSHLFLESSPPSNFPYPLHKVFPNFLPN